MRRIGLAPGESIMNSLIGSLTACLLAFPGPPLEGTEPWSPPEDPAAAMVDGIHRFLDREIAASRALRDEAWKLGTAEERDRRIAELRSLCARRIGAVGERERPVRLEVGREADQPEIIAEDDKVAVRAVRWTVYPGAWAEGLWLEPKGGAGHGVVAIPDADASPESLAGLIPGVPAERQVARLLAERGCRVLVPVLIGRECTFSGDPRIRMTNLSHREWIYRQAYEVGRHILGYEVDAARSAADWLRSRGAGKVGIFGYGEGGRVALAAAAIDPGIDVAWIAGAFGPREGAWSEPIDRDIFGTLREFGDAELARLVLPRKLLIEDCTGPEVAGPPKRPEGGGGQAAPGRLTAPEASAVRAEVDRIGGATDSLIFLATTEGARASLNRSNEAFALFCRRGLEGENEAEFSPDAGPLSDARRGFDPVARQRRMFDAWVGYTQGLVRTSDLRRQEAWKGADPSTPAKWSETIAPFREAFWTDLIGKFPPASEPLGAFSAKTWDEPNFVGYDVMLPVWPDVFAYGVLLLPKDLKPGERRPVVVCQHGLEGRPQVIVDSKARSPYNSYGAALADRGYIVFAPQNPYIGQERFRSAVRKAHPLGMSLYGIIVRQHERILEWLATLPNVDAKRVAFYGLSYGGKSAMRIPAILPGYCLSICSADFNEWVLKNTSIDRKYSYLFTFEHDMVEFALAERFNYAEMAGLICPRPFMVERGHDDAVAPDEWVAHEYAKVRRLYDRMGLGDRTAIEFSDGGHMIFGKGTFAFLARHLDWPRGAAPLVIPEP